MATRTLKAKYESEDDSVGRSRAILCHSGRVKEIYYQFEDEQPEVPAESSTESTPAAPVAAAAAPVLAAVSAAPSGPAATITDELLKTVETLRAIIAQKLKKPLEDISLSKSIKDLLGGKSTLQNEILGDLQLEFSSAPEKAEELPLEELGSSMQSGYSGTLGKHTSGMVSRLTGGKMPGAFNLSAVKGHLSKALHGV